MVLVCMEAGGVKMEKTINIDGRNITFRASAAIPRLYRMKFRRDIFSDRQEVSKARENSKKDGEDGEEKPIPPEVLSVFENMAFLMAKHADASQVPQKTVEEWLDTFPVFSIYQIFPEIIELWGMNLEGMSENKKNKADRPGV